MAAHGEPVFNIQLNPTKRDQTISKMSSSQPYQYAPIASVKPTNQNNHALQTDEKSQSVQVRLLTLKPHNFDEDIHIDIRSVWLDPGTPAPYEALSYVWGSADKSHLVYVGQTKQYILQVNRNLHCALQHLRDEFQERTLWIDAICIDQSNIEERGSQVAQMGDIYRRAQQVVVWLGPGNDDSKFALELLDDRGSKVEFDGGKTREKLANGREGTDTVNLSQREMDALLSLFNRSWFDRLWVRQEIYLGKQNAILTAGHERIPWKHFSNCALWIWHWGTNLTLDFRQRLVEISTLLTLSYPTSLPYLRYLFGRCHCSDERDRIYSTTNLLYPHERKFIGFPDYTLSTIDVHKRATSGYINYYLKNGPSAFALTILSECHGTEPFDTPTWIPKWKTDEKDKTSYFHFFGAAGTSFTPKAKIIEGDILQVLGVAVQTIQQVMPSTSQWIFHLKDFLSSIDINQPYPSGGTTLEACSQVISGGHVGETKSPASNGATLLEGVKYIEWILSLTTEDEIEWRRTGRNVYGLGADIILGRSLIRTQEGYIGIAPRNVQSGDLVVVLAGFFQPVVLRRSARDPLRYHLIGTCFVWGFMAGEAFPGLLPPKHYYALRHVPGDEYSFMELFNMATESFVLYDPRIKHSWPLDPEQQAKAIRDRKAYAYDVDFSTFKKMGINVEYFDII